MVVRVIGFQIIIILQHSLWTYFHKISSIILIQYGQHTYSVISDIEVSLYLKPVCFKKNLELEAILWTFTGKQNLLEDLVIQNNF